MGTRAYRLKLPDTWRIHPMFHELLLKYWRESTMLQVPGDVGLEDVDKPGYFKVEKILRVLEMELQDPQRQREFLVLWQGYPAEDAEWILASFLATRMLRKLILRPVKLKKKSEATTIYTSVSKDKNPSMGGNSCGQSSRISWEYHRGSCNDLGEWLGIVLVPMSI